MNTTFRSGFTLLEILITLAILGIIAAVALPSFQESTLRARRAEAKTALLETASDQERFYSANSSYSTNAMPLANPAQELRTSRDGFYQISVAACGTGTIANCFVATATPLGDQANDECTSLTLSDTGVRGATGSTIEECWQR
jgi:type IV pilus assembly protein PilE